MRTCWGSWAGTGCTSSERNCRSDRQRSPSDCSATGLDRGPIIDLPKQLAAIDGKIALGQGTATVSYQADHKLTGEQQRRDLKKYRPDKEQGFGAVSNVVPIEP